MVPKFRKKYVVYENGKATCVNAKEYRTLLEQLEALEAIRAYDSAKTSGDEAIPFEQAIDEIE